MWQCLKFLILQQRKQNTIYDDVNVWLYYKIEKVFWKHCSAKCSQQAAAGSLEVSGSSPFFRRAGPSRGLVSLWSYFLWFQCPNWCSAGLLVVEMCGYNSDLWAAPAWTQLSHKDTRRIAGVPAEQCWSLLMMGSGVAAGGPIKSFGGCIRAVFSVSPFPAQCPVWQSPESESSPSPPAKTWKSVSSSLEPECFAALTPSHTGAWRINDTEIQTAWIQTLHTGSDTTTQICKRVLMAHSEEGKRESRYHFKT